MVKPDRHARRRPAGAAGVNGSESPLAWLRRRKDKEGNPLISAAQYDAGERLRADFYFAQMTPRTTSSWSGMPVDRGVRRSAPGAGIDLADSIVAAKQRVYLALCSVGGDLAGILIDVCGHLKGLEQFERGEGLPQRSGKFLLGMALTRLGQHYGLIRREDDREIIGRRLRHWGSDDYRPTLDHWTK